MKCLLTFAFLSAAALAAPVKMVTSLTDLAWAAKQIGKNHVEVKSLLKGTENPHYVDTVPEYIRLVADAQVVCFVGLELEIGWLPKVLSRSGNAAVQPGGKGHCETSKQVRVIEKPAGPVDRSMGDLHPYGNPHFWLKPTALGEAGTEIAEALIRIDPSHAGDYRNNLKQFQRQMAELQQTIKRKLSPALAKHKGTAVIEYHKEFAYLFEAYGIQSLGSIEEKPGVPPSAGRIAEQALAAKKAGVRIALAGEYQPKSTLTRFQEISGITSVQVPTASQPDGKVKDYLELQNFLVDTVYAAISSPST